MGHTKKITAPHHAILNGQNQKKLLKNTDGFLNKLLSTFGPDKVWDSLVKFGFATTENILNEWRFGPNDEWDVIFRCRDPRRKKEKAREMNGRAAASFAAAVLLDMQNGPVSLANYYTGDTMPYFGMFDIYGTPLDPYQAFLCFAALTKGRQQVAVLPHNSIESLHCIATLDDEGRVRMMVVNDSPRPVRLTLALANQTVPWTIEHAAFWPELTQDQLNMPAHARSRERFPSKV